ncbi:hypothetical protein DMH08_23815 [Actinomadura sp. WAC 06369]|nr:hypothetical protein DMH08_23815 [Actinomadura sp. WAC 06369]
MAHEVRRCARVGGPQIVEALYPHDLHVTEDRRVVPGRALQGLGQPLGVAGVDRVTGEFDVHTVFRRDAPCALLGASQVRELLGTQRGE